MRSNLASPIRGGADEVGGEVVSPMPSPSGEGGPRSGADEVLLQPLPLLFLPGAQGNLREGFLFPPGPPFSFQACAVRTCKLHASVLVFYLRTILLHTCRGAALSARKYNQHETMITTSPSSASQMPPLLEGETRGHNCAQQPCLPSQGRWHSRRL